MNRRLVVKVGATAILTLFYPAADAPPMSQRKFISNIIDYNKRLRESITKRGWPQPTTYMGEGVDIANLRVKQLYGVVVVQTRSGQRYILIQLNGDDYRVAGIYTRQPDQLPAPKTLSIPSALLAANVPWSTASRALGVT